MITTEKKIEDMEIVGTEQKTVMQKKPTIFEIMGMSRSERRRIGKINGVKIPGINRADLEIAKKKALEREKRK